MPQNVGGEDYISNLPDSRSKSNSASPLIITNYNNNCNTKAQNGAKTPPLTQETLQKHDLRCELECKDNWKRRLIRDLSLKRIAPVNK